MTSQWENYLCLPRTATILYAKCRHLTAVGLRIQSLFFTGNQLFFANASQVSAWSPAVTATAVYAYTGDELQLGLDPLTGVAGVTIPDPDSQSFSENGGAPVLGDAENPGLGLWRRLPMA